MARTNVAVPNPGHLTCCRETSIGDLCTDAYRWASQADVAIINGGGIRSGLPQGEVTYENILQIFPFSNHLACCECKGQDILDALEHSYRVVQTELGPGPTYLGGSGGFLSVSGLKCTIDTSVPSTVEVGEHGLFSTVKGARRVKDVQIMDRSGKYVPIDPRATYKVASNDFTLKNCGDGFNMFADKYFPIERGEEGGKVLINYLEHLKGDVSRYANVDGRITVR